MLRSRATIPERMLWNKLKRRQIRGLRFRRQHAIGPYIVDFYCPANGLVVELDGRTHEGEDAQEHDASRTNWLTDHGLRVIRFTNDDVITNLHGVVATIAHEVDQPGSRTTLPRSTTPPPNPLPEGGGVRKTPDLKRRDLERRRNQTPLISALVPNEKGFERAQAIHRAGLPLKIALFTAASETFNRKNINASIAESIERFRPIVPRAMEAGMPMRIYISCAIACPFEGAVAPGQVRRVVDDVLAIFPDDVRRQVDIDLGDTIGVAHPADIAALLSMFTADEMPQLTLHLHDTFGRAADCVRAALHAGVRSFDSSAGGLGGCPYATTADGTRAPGNISTELLVATIESEGFSTTVDRDALARAGAFANPLREGAS